MRNLGLLKLLLAACLCGLVLPACAESALAPSRGGAPEYLEDDPPSAAADDDDDGTGDDDDDETHDDDDDGVDRVGVHLVSTDPEVGSDTHLYRHPIVLEFNIYAASVDVALYDEVNQLVPLQLLWNEGVTRLEAWPTLPLEPDSGYRVVLGLGDAAIEFEFRTSPVGRPVNPVDVSDLVYALDFSAASSPSSPALAALLASSANTATWLLETTVQADQSVSVDIAFGLGAPADRHQSSCSATSLANDLVGNGGELEEGGSYFWVGGSSMTLPLDALSLEFEDWQLSGDFSPDGQSLVALEFSGELSAASLGFFDETEACEWLDSSLGSSCAPCVSDSAAQCAWVDVADFDGLATPLELNSQGPGNDDACDEDNSGLLSCSFASGTASSAGLLGLGLALLGLALRRRS